MTTKRVIIMRGLPGSGKTTLAQDLLKELPMTVKRAHISADHFFMVDGQYRFDPRKLGEAHTACMCRFIAAIQAECEVIIVDNTNTQRWEYTQYVRLAELQGYEVSIQSTMNVKADVTVEDLQLWFKRQTHGVPAEIFGAMALRWEE